MTISDLLDRIDAASISANVYRTVRRLLDRVDPETACTIISFAEAMELVGTDSLNTVRGHLGQLKRAGLCDYTLNGRVIVEFTADHSTIKSDRHTITEAAVEGPGDRSTIKSDRHTITEAAIEDPDDRHTIKSDRSTITGENDVIATRSDLIATRSRDRHTIKSDRHTIKSDRVAIKSTDTDSQSVSQYDLPPPGKRLTDRLTVSDDSKRRSFALLTDPEVGLEAGKAQELAETYPWERVQAAVFAWLRDPAAEGHGALVHRVRQGWGSILAKDHETEIWRRHADPIDEAEELRRKYVPDDYSDIILH